jgi:AcrR family transcriptional regulator
MARKPKGPGIPTATPGEVSPPGAAFQNTSGSRSSGPGSTAGAGATASASTTPPRGNSSGSGNRQKIIDAFMGLLAVRPIEEIGFADIAARAGLSLAELRDEFNSVLGILAAHIKAMDRKVLTDSGSDMEDESPRERLFDVLMRRIEALTDHKAAVRSLLRSAQYDPPLALALNSMAVRSMEWMLTAADIDAAGTRGLIRAQGLAVLYSRVLRVWFRDDDEGLARTMAALDRQLANGQRWAGLLDGLYRLQHRLCRRGDRFRDRVRPRDERDDAAIAI